MILSWSIEFSLYDNLLLPMITPPPKYAINIRSMRNVTRCYFKVVWTAQRFIDESFQLNLYTFQTRLKHKIYIFKVFLSVS